MREVKTASLTPEEENDLMYSWEYLEKYLIKNRFMNVDEFEAKCPTGYTPVDVDPELKFAFIVKHPWKFTIYYNESCRGVILQSEVRYYNTVTQEWEGTSYL